MRITEEDIERQKMSDPEEKEKEQKDDVKTEKEKLSELRGKKKLGYLWDYYKWVLIVVAAVIVGISIVVTSIRNASNIELLYVMMIDAQINTLDDTGFADDVKNMLDPEQDGNYVTVDTTCYTQDDGSLDYDSTMLLTVKVAAQELDVEILPKSVYENYEEQGMFMSISDVMGENFVKEHPEILDGEGLPVDDNAVLAQYGYSFEDQTVLAVCANTENIDQVKAFIQFLGY